ncbi:hypothetical protein RRG08_042031 [Elysia crispata]|uniref:C-type lectin domain-containing protein n=1 Tax=Elysia crispata TaxID=231223 RepID=A0AAE0Z9C9_9GAST|nr:hypothetical protein RRG08_042031 [Elysia crispata]
MQVAIFVLVLLVFKQGKGELFDFHIISSRQSSSDGEMLCQSLGYDGLAIINAPEMFTYAIRITVALRATGHGLYLGLRNKSDTNLVNWDDGTFPAQDLPWKPNPQSWDFTYNHYGILSHTGYYRALSNEEKKYAVCGNHENLPTEAFGTTILGQQPTGISSSLSVTKVLSYLECVLLCGQDHRCRVAEFKIDFLTCMTLGPGSYESFSVNVQSKTFVRKGFT